MKMHRPSFAFALAIANFLACTALLQGQEGTPLPSPAVPPAPTEENGAAAAAVEPKKSSIQDAVENARRRTGRQIVKLVSLTARGAEPYPVRWEMKFYDPASPTFITVLEGNGRAEPGGNDYAEGLPPTYFDLNRVKIDVPRAFELVEAEANAAKVGFDKLDYTLRAREFSQEPVWSLRLVNAEQQLMGMVELSAETGRIYRTVWLGREGGDIQITDSSLVTAPPAATAPAKPTPQDPPPSEDDGPIDNLPIPQVPVR